MSTTEMITAIIIYILINISMYFSGNIYCIWAISIFNILILISLSLGLIDIYKLKKLEEKENLRIS